MNTSTLLLSGRYRLDAPLGEGGMAIVTRGVDLQLGVPRALKILLPELARKRALRERFEAEARIMARLEHPHVVRVFDVGIHGGRVPYIAMECLPGGTLHSWLQRFGPMPAGLAARVTLDLCAAVAHAHAKGVIHRDIKPQNALITERGLVKLTDFGIARTDEGRTRTGAAMGTLGYVAPEQLANARDATAAADIYSLAVTLWKLITDGAPESLAYDLHHGALEAVPTPLREVLVPALAQRVEQRTADVATFTRALSAAAAELPPGPTPDLRHEPPPAANDCPSWDTLSHTLGEATPPEPAAAPRVSPPRPPPRAARPAEPVGPYVVRLTDEDLQATLEARESRMRRSAEPKPVERLEDRLGPEPAPVDPVGWGRRVVNALGGAGRTLVFGAMVLLLPLGLIRGLHATDRAFDLRGTQAALAESAAALVDRALHEGPDVVRDRQRAGDTDADELTRRYHALEDAEGEARVEAARLFVEAAEQQLATELHEDPQLWTPEQRQEIERLTRMRQALEAYWVAQDRAGAGPARPGDDATAQR
jgi:serine/threonine protein kinase